MHTHLASQVVKKGGQLLMTGKAYNNRCIAEWLHDAAKRSHRMSTDPRMPVAYLLMTLDLYLLGLASIVMLNADFYLDLSRLSPL